MTDTIAFCLFGVFAFCASPFVAAHVVDTWDSPEYFHSGFCPDSEHEIDEEGGER